LPDVDVLAVDDENSVAPLRVHVETRLEVAGCAGCGTRACLKDRREVSLVDLPAFGRPAVLVWHKRRWSCPDADCPVGTFTEIDRRIAAPRARLTDRAGRWVTAQVGRAGRTV
jgi:transposase